MSFRLHSCWLGALKNKHFYTDIIPRITAPPYTFHCLLFNPANKFMIFMEAKETIDVELGLQCGPGSVVGKATGYGMDGTGIES
jgi:hypothetical protein